MRERTTTRQRFQGKIASATGGEDTKTLDGEKRNSAEISIQQLTESGKCSTIDLSPLSLTRSFTVL